MNSTWDGIRSRETTFCLHVGMPKTATTYLQQKIFNKHSQIEYLGKHEGIRHNESVRKYADVVIHEYFGHFQKNHRGVHSKALQKLQSYHSKARSLGKLLMFSKEGLVGFPEKSRQRMIEVLERTIGPIQVLLTLREPVSFTEAYYYQNLKGYQFKSIPVLAKHFSSAPRHFTINEWLKVVFGNGTPLTRLLSYGEAARQYAEILGKDRVHILAFEQLKVDSDQFWNNLSESLEIDVSETLALSQAKPSNERWSQRTIDRLIELQDSPEEVRKQFQRAKRNEKVEMLGLKFRNQNLNGKKPKAVISPEFERQLRDFSRKQNDIIQTEFDIPLEEFGYDVSSSVSESRDSTARRAA